MGCARWHDRAGGSSPDEDGLPYDDQADSEDTTHDGDADGDSEDDLVDPELPEPDCARPAPAGAPKLIDRDVPVDRVVLGPCGELAYESADITHVLDASFARELVSATDPTRVRFSPDGALFMAHGQGVMTIYDLVTDRRSDLVGEGGFLLQTPDWWHDGVSQPRSVPFVCDRAGLGLFVDGAVDTRFPGPCSVPETFDDWRDLRWGEHGSRVLYRDEADRLHAADFAIGTDVPIALASAASADDWGFDFLYLSDDGRVLVHVAGWDESCGDTFCAMSDGTATVFDLDTQLTHRVPAALVSDWHDVNILEGRPGSHRLAIEGAEAMTLLAFAGELMVHEVRGLAPLAILDGKDEVLGRKHPEGALELVPFTGGSQTRITPTSERHDPWEPPDVAVSRDGSVIAYAAYRARRCEQNPALHDCETQLWEVVVWSREQGELAAHLALQPASPLWVGDDGSVLVQGPLARENEGLGSNTVVLDTAGNVLAKYSAALQVLGLRDGFLLVAAGEVPGGGPALWRFDQATGAGATMAVRPASVPANASLSAWVDRAEQRLVYAFHWYDSAASSERSELYAGQLPRL